MEPVNKKSGFDFKRERDRKNKLREEVLRKTSKIDVFFKKASADVNEPVDEHQKCNEILQSNRKSDTNEHEKCIDLMLSDFENNTLCTDHLTNTPGIDYLQCDENLASEASSDSEVVSNTQFGTLIKNVVFFKQITISFSLFKKLISEKFAMNLQSGIKMMTFSFLSYFEIKQY